METKNPPEAHLYVKSRKVVTSFYRPKSSQLQAPGPDTAGVSPGWVDSGSSGMGDAQVEYMLSDDQARVVALVEEVAAKRGYSLKVTDLGRANPLTQVVEHFKGSDRYPVLLVPGTPHRLEGPEAFTTERLATALPAEPTFVRSFSYLKVKTAELEKVKSALLAFPEVKEIHVITGDWDLLVMLEFPPKEGAGKRHVLEFIIEKVAKVGGVEDTSTMVPEYTITKLPL